VTRSSPLGGLPWKEKRRRDLGAKTNRPNFIWKKENSAKQVYSPGEKKKTKKKKNPEAKRGALEGMEGGGGM